MRDDEVARAGELPDAAIPSPKELDRRIDIVAADSARAPDSHVRRQLLFRLIRYLCRAMRRRRNRIVANQRGTHIGRQAAASASMLPDGHAARRSEWHTRRIGGVPSGCCHMEAAPPRGRRREVLASCHLENLAGRLCWGIEMLPASELDKSSPTQFSTCGCSELHTQRWLSFESQSSATTVSYRTTCQTFPTLSPLTSPGIVSLT